ncbi:clathrin adaptor complexes medium subunit family protein [Wolffia australiana]
MVVLAASVVSKSGKALVSRQFVDMSRIRIEGLLAAFPKLIGTGKQHTYVETENVRYVYQPVETVYLLLVTNKQSNILEDLETLRLLSKLVPEYAVSLDEEGICSSAFDLIFAFDEAISLGQKENVTVAQVKQYCEMESHEEKLHKLVMQSKINETKDVMKRKASEIDKSKIEKGKVDKGGYSSISSSGRIESSFNDMNISSGPTGFGSASGFGSNTSVDSFSTPSRGRPAALAPAPMGQGMQLGKTKRASQFLESLKAEGEVIIEDVKPSIANEGKVSLPSTDPIAFSIEEKLNVTLKRDGGVGTFDIQGTLSVQILNQDDGHIQFQVENRSIPGLTFRTHPNINKELFNSDHVVGLKDPNRPFPSGQNDVGVVKWRIQSMDESAIPLTVNCWPSISGNETFVNIEYEASDLCDLHNVVISVPLPALREAPSVRQIDGEWRFNPRNSTLEWSILLIDGGNRSGSMEFVVPAADPSAFFPINIRFSAVSTFSDVKVTDVFPLRGGAPPKFSQRAQLLTDSYQVI